MCGMTNRVRLSALVARTRRSRCALSEDNQHPWRRRRAVEARRRRDRELVSMNPEEDRHRKRRPRRRAAAMAATSWPAPRARGSKVRNVSAGYREH